MPPLGSITQNATVPRAIAGASACTKDQITELLPEPVAPTNNR